MKRRHTSNFSRAMSYTMVGTKRLRSVEKSCIKVLEKGIPGDFVECGVYKGGCSILGASILNDRTTWCYDTFSGMSKPSEIDTKRKSGAKITPLEKWKTDKNWCTCSLEDVKANFNKSGVNINNVRFVEGMVEDTLLVDDNLPEQISVLRLDTDFYASTKIELEVLYPRLVPGGFLLIDDYGAWNGCKIAVDEYFSGDRKITFDKVDDTGIFGQKPVYRVAEV